MKADELLWQVGKGFLYLVVGAIAAGLVGMFFTDVTVVDVGQLLINNLEGGE